MVHSKYFDNTRNRRANNLKTEAFFACSGNIAPKIGAFKALIFNFCTPETGDYSIFTSLYQFYMTYFKERTNTNKKASKGSLK